MYRNQTNICPNYNFIYNKGLHALTYPRSSSALQQVFKQTEE